MTIEEYLRKRIEEETKFFLETDDIPRVDFGYFKGVIDGLKEILSHLPSFDHEVTLREIQKMCLEHDCNCVSKGKECCLRDDGYCMVNDVSPNNIDVDDIQKGVKEARK